MYEAGDGRVTRASVLASHLPGAEDTETGSGIAEVSQAFFGSADHHGIYSEPTFQSLLLRLLLRAAPRRRIPPAGPAEGAPERDRRGNRLDSGGLAGEDSGAAVPRRGTRRQRRGEGAP